MLRESFNQPLMVIFEELHWIDGEQTRALLVVDTGGEPSDAAVVCRHAAEDRSAAVAGGIR
jgi:hypothetical protein